MRLLKNNQNRCREGSIYITVTAVAMILSMIGLTTLHLSRLELRATTSLAGETHARYLAQSSVEMALARIRRYPDWRTRYTHDVEVTVQPDNFTLPMRFKLLDRIDNDLADDDTEAVEIQGIGQANGATFIYRVDYSPIAEVGPTLLRGFNSDSTTQTGIETSVWLGQYFLPNLPAEAIDWAVTSVEVELKRTTGGGSADPTLICSLHLPTGTLLPGAQLSTTSVLRSELPNTQNVLYDFEVTGVSGLDPAVGLCIALTTTDSSPANVVFKDSGVSETNAHLVMGGNGSWTSLDTGQSLHYRVNGYYTTTNGEFSLQSGSWESIEAN